MHPKKCRVSGSGIKTQTRTRNPKNPKIYFFLNILIFICENNKKLFFLSFNYWFMPKS